jgi:hypothetical protein
MKQLSDCYVTIFRCDIPAAVREYVTVTSWLHEEGTAIEITAEREPRGKYTLLQSGDLVIIDKLLSSFK